MASSLYFTPICSLNSSRKPGVLIGNSVSGRVLRINRVQNSNAAKFQSLVVKATDGNQSSPKSRSILCPDCEGNGAVRCSQCKGNGVNSVDHFNGQFKAGALCWLCRGKRDILCGNCNGAGFVGGFMSTSDG